MTPAPHLPGFRPGSAGSIENGWNTVVDTRSQLKSQTFLRLCRERQVERICRIPRLVAELLDEIARHHGLAEDIDRRLAAYAALDPDLLHQVGGDRFAPAPIRAVGGDR